MPKRMNRHSNKKLLFCCCCLLCLQARNKSHLDILKPSRIAAILFVQPSFFVEQRTYFCIGHSKYVRVPRFAKNRIPTSWLQLRDCWSRGAMIPHILSVQVTLSELGGHMMPTKLLFAPPHRFSDLPTALISTTCFLDFNTTCMGDCIFQMCFHLVCCANQANDLTGQFKSTYVFLGCAQLWAVFLL